ncbi:dihydrofolate reductase [Nakamurella sp. YIM 132087]|uniref:Dihydrofolate reductase n=1 Tax=Nakamurella alba TaxID=2665158 RepID=A0A7K1FPU1_9ACTN|nr:dihydrofolate reductase family protein [Nakamurella alba]MTD16166.1 dihydrofolate reductase [Nakamurella alba]
MTRYLTAQLFISLDGVVESPEEWHFPFVDDELLELVNDEQEDASTLLLGRRTYENFAASWPLRDDSVPLAKHLNSMEKVVVSDTLEKADWENSRILRPRGDLAGVVRELTAGAGEPITVAGSIDLVVGLLQARLLNDLQLLVHPVVVGRGRRLFDNWTGEPLRLDSGMTVAETSSGVRRLSYFRSRRR